jgi:outer membrane receptor protein involved in Fe transport
MRVSQFIESPNKLGSIMWGVARGDGSNVASNLANNTSAKSVGKGDTYTAGGTYKVIDQGNSGLLNGISIFAGTSSSFVIQGGNQQDPKKFNGFSTVQALKDYIASLAPNPVDPQKGKGWEVGTRFQLLDRRVSVSVAYFDQQRENISRSFFVRQSLVPGETNELALATYQLASGKEQSKGVDADITWQFTNSFSFLAGAMLSQGKVLSNPESPEEVGFGLVSSPETQYNFWISYRAPKESILSGLSAGLGASYKSSTRIRPQVADRFRVSDAYTEGRAMLRYKIPGKKYSHELGLTIDNLLDKEYTDEGNWLSDPRTFKGSYTISW